MHEAGGDITLQEVPAGDWVYIGYPWHFERIQLAAGGVLSRYTKKIRYGDSA